MKGQPTRERIVLAAVDLIAGGGIRALTSSELVRRSGVSKGGLYHHFTSMDAVLKAAAGASLKHCSWLLAPAEGVTLEQRLAELQTANPELPRVIACLHAEAGFDELLAGALEDFWDTLSTSWQGNNTGQVRAQLMLGLLGCGQQDQASGSAALNAACRSA